MPSANNPHAGHRKRLKEHFRATGFKDWPPERVLEFILFFGRPRVDVAPMARNLIARYNDVRTAVNAPLNELLKIEDLDQNSAFLLHALSELRRYLEDCAFSQAKLDTAQAQIDHLRPYFSQLRHEAVYLLCLDGRRRSLGVREIARGSSRQVKINIKAATRAAVGAEADCVVMAHNHLTGVHRPSAADFASTSSVRAALAQVDIELLDHVIFSDSGVLRMSLYATPTDL